MGSFRVGLGLVKSDGRDFDQSRLELRTELITLLGI